MEHSRIGSGQAHLYGWASGKLEAQARPNKLGPVQQLLRNLDFFP